MLQNKASILEKDRFGGLRIEGRLELPPGDGLVERIEKLLLNNALELKISPDEEDLECTHSSAIYFQFIQKFNGIEVLDSDIRVTLDRYNYIRSIIISRIVPRTVESSQSNPEIDPKKIVLDRVKPKVANLTEPESFFAISEDGMELLPVYVLFGTFEGPLTYRFVIKKNGGDLISQVTMSIGFPFIGSLLFNPNPIVSMNLQQTKGVSQSLEDAIWNKDESKVSHLIDALRKDSQVENIELKSRSTPYVRIISNGQIILQENRADYPSSDEEFDQLMVLFHIQEFQKYLLMIDDEFRLSNLPLDVEIRSGFKGAEFCLPNLSVPNPHITMGGPGPHDNPFSRYAQDGKMIIHEYSHALFDDLVGGYSPFDLRTMEYNAMSEAYALLFPCVYFSGKYLHKPDGLYEWTQFLSNTNFATTIDRSSDPGLYKYDEWLSYINNQRDQARDADNIAGYILATALWKSYQTSIKNPGILSEWVEARDKFFRRQFQLFRSIGQGTTVREAMKTYIDFLSSSDQEDERELKNQINCFRDMHIFYGASEDDIIIENCTFNLEQPESTSSLSFLFVNSAPKIRVAIKNNANNTIDIGLLCFYLYSNREADPIKVIFPILDLAPMTSLNLDFPSPKEDAIELRGYSIKIDLWIPSRTNGEEYGYTKEYSVTIK